MLALVGTDIATVSMRLFLVIVLDLPSDFFLGDDRKSGDVRKVCRM